MCISPRWTVTVGRLVSDTQKGRSSAHGLAVVGLLTEAQRARRLLEVAARAAQASAAILHGEDELALELNRTASIEGASVEGSYILVVRRGELRWPMLRPPLLQSAVEAFVRERAMPSLVAMGDSARSFSMQVRSHPLKLHVMLMHRSGAHGPHDESEEALDAMRHVAARHDGEALFLSYDFFDNDPDAFSAHKVYVSELPVALAVHDRGGFHERTWRLPAGRGGEKGIDEDDIEHLVERAIGELKGSAAGRLAAREQQRVLELPPGFWDGVAPTPRDGDRDEL